jgi:cell wall-associated NlpC family hydrolase
MARRHSWALLFIVTGLWFGVAAAASAADPTPVPDTTVSSSSTAEALNTPEGKDAQQSKDAAHQAVVALSRRISRESRQVAALSITASLAQQRYTSEQAVQAKAQAEESGARAQLQSARTRYRANHDALVAIAVSSYETDTAPGSVSTSSAVALLTVTNPSDMLTVLTEQDMLGKHQATVVVQMASAVQTLDSAEQTQQSALDSVVTETTRLGRIRRHATVALAASRRAVRDLEGDLVTANATQRQTDAALSTFLSEWSAAHPVLADVLNGDYVAIARNARHAAAASRADHSSSAMGQQAVYRALQYIGTPYAWAAGNSAGPTRGVCVAGPARNDCHVTGFDCSGLTLYAWAPYVPMAHFAATQYSYGTLHPAANNLQPGDLVFWSTNHTVAGIHHVALYVGNGNVIQAPQSGDIVRITPLNSVAAGYFGATRPLS